MKTRDSTVDRYIRSFPVPTQKRLKQLRAIIREAAPAASEKISYHMPTFVLNGTLVHIAAYENHIGLYGALSAFRVFESEVAAYKTAKGTLRFSNDRPIPAELVRKIVEFRVQENSTKAKKKR